MKPHLLLPLLLLSALLAAAASATERDPTARELGRIGRMLSHRNLVAYDLAPLPFADSTADLPPDLAGRTVALVRTAREPGGADWKPADPLYDTVAVLERGRLAVERIGPFRRSAIRLLDLDRDDALEAVLAPLPGRESGRADLVVIDALGGITLFHRIRARGFDAHELLFDPSTGLHTLIHRFLDTPHAARKSEHRYGFTRHGPTRIDAPPDLAPPLHPTRDDERRAADATPRNLVAARAFLAEGAPHWRGPDAFSFTYRIDRTPTDLSVDVRVRDTRPDLRPKAGDRVTLALAGYAARTSPLLLTVRPAGSGVKGQDLPSAVRLEPIPVESGYGFRLTVPASLLAPLGIAPRDPAFLFRLEAFNSDGPGLEKSAQLLSSNGRTGASRADLSIVVTDAGE